MASGESQGCNDGERPEEADCFCSETGLEPSLWRHGGCHDISPGNEQRSEGLSTGPSCYEVGHNADTECNPLPDDDCAMKSGFPRCGGDRHVLRLPFRPVDSGKPKWVVSGGIGSGKSALRRLLEAHGFFTVDADSVGHEVLARAGPAFREVARRWPDVVVNGEIDRSELAEIVFADESSLRELEEITHPHIFGMIETRIQGIPDPLAVEIPLLESPFVDGWQRLIVDCTDEIRLERLVARGMSADDARSRMQAQPSRREWLSRADLVVPNHGDLGELEAALQLLLAPA